MNAVAEKQKTESVLKRFPRRRIWTKKEYYKLIDNGFFIDKRAELIEGDIIEFSSMKSSHAVTIGLFTNVLKEVLSENYDIRGQLPLDFSEISEPEPDIAVVRGNPRDYLETHPNTAELIVEISASTLSYDRNVKGKLYARNNIQDYWIVDLRKRCIEVYRSPKADKYENVTTFTESDDISTLTKPENKLKVADLLP
jgi:Uma2 family endonuclease